MEIIRALKKILLKAQNFLISSETMEKSKKKWSELAKQNAKYVIWTDKENASEEEFRASGKEAYSQYVAHDAFLQKILGETQTKSALDIGCGIGRITEFFIPDFNQVYGIDIASGMIEQAKQRLPDPRYHFFEGDGLHFPIPSQTIDFVFSFIVFQHMPLRETVESNLKETFRVLVNGGVAKIQLRGTEVDKRQWFYGVSFSQDQARRLAKECGFEILKIEQETDRHLWLWLRKK